MASEISILDGTIARVDEAVRSLSLDDGMREVLVELWVRFRLDYPFEWTMTTFRLSVVIVLSTTLHGPLIRAESGITRRTPILSTFGHSAC